MKTENRLFLNVYLAVIHFSETIDPLNWLFKIAINHLSVFYSFRDLNVESLKNSPYIIILELKPMYDL